MIYLENPGVKRLALLFLGRFQIHPIVLRGLVFGGWQRFSQPPSLIVGFAIHFGGLPTRRGPPVEVRTYPAVA